MLSHSWVVTKWSLGGHWVVTGWSLGGHWVVTGWSLGGNWVVTGCYYPAVAKHPSMAHERASSTPLKLYFFLQCLFRVSPNLVINVSTWERCLRMIQAEMFESRR